MPSHNLTHADRSELMGHFVVIVIRCRCAVHYNKVCLPKTVVLVFAGLPSQRQ
jgi:hypothetical protein